ncbi:hypothetical protein IKW72_05245 [bacterium]|nr:hypothetical protein [bacterium]
MSFVITTYVPDGIVMAADSRMTALAQGTAPDGQALPDVNIVISDHCDKIFFLENQGIGISAFGDPMLGGKPVSHAIRLFEEEANNPGDGIMDVVNNLMSFMSSRYPNANTSFHVAGYAMENGVSVPHVYHCQISQNIIKRLNLNDRNGEINYGTSWGGQGDVMARLINARALMPTNGPKKDDKIPMAELPNFPIRWDIMPLIDAIDFTELAVDITIQMQRFQMRPQDVGGAIDMLLLTPKGADWLYKKQFTAHDRD